MPKYRQVKAPRDYSGKVYSWRDRVLEHHLVWWQHTGMVVPEGYVVHHKNGDGKDNRFRNLELKEGGKHTSDHNLKGEKEVQVTCGFCGCPVRRLARDVRFRRAKGQTKFFCSKSHAAKYQNAHRENKCSFTHGTPSAYNHHRCRCGLCKKNHAKRITEYKSRKRRAVRLAAGQ